MTDRPTPGTDLIEQGMFGSDPKLIADFARRLERERDEARDTIVDVLSALKPMHNEGPRLAALRIKEERDEALDAVEKAKAFKRVMKEDNAKLRRELDEARDDHRFLLREIFNLTQIGDPHPADLPMKALQAIAEMINERLKEARK